MGFNTTVMICNDVLHEIEKDKDFGAKLYEAISNLHGGEQFGLRTEFMGGGVKAIETHHASGYVLVAVGGNTGKVIGHTIEPPTTYEEKVEWVKAIARSVGFYLRKVPNYDPNRACYMI